MIIAAAEVKPLITGFDKNDVVAKLKLRSNQDAKYKQSLEFKFQ